jgi:hypothetical protein
MFFSILMLAILSVSFSIKNIKLLKNYEKFNLLCFVILLTFNVQAQNPVGIFENHLDIGNVLNKGNATFANGA